MKPSSDRLTGVLLAAACADALGAGYEFGAPIDASNAVQMRGQGAFVPGEWTDDTAQLVAIAMAAADGHATCIALGSHGKGLGEELLLGSVSQAIIRDSTIPVLVTH